MPPSAPDFRQAPPQKSGMSTGTKILIGLVGFFALGFVGCVGVVALAASGDGSDEASGNNEQQGETALPFDDSPEDASDTNEFGSLENPYPFGTPHSREPGLLGAGWTVSIDEVRTIKDSEFFTPEVDGTCLAVVGTATLDSLDNEDELTSNGFSFPQIKMVVEGKDLDSDIAACEVESLNNEGLTWILDAELTPGTTIQWYQTFRPTTDGTYDFVAIENDVYAAE